MTFKKPKERDLTNRKPYRTKANKALAAKHAVKCKDGAFRVDPEKAPLSYHPERRS